MRWKAIAIVPMFAGLAFAQARTETRTTTTTWNGTLVDAACQSTHVLRDESRQANPDRSTTTRTTRTEVFDCPVTPTTSSFGLVTSDGRYIRFDNPSNTRVVEIVRSNSSLSAGTPTVVEVRGTAQGDVAVVESLTQEGGSPVRTVEVERSSSRSGPDTIFDVRHGDDDGKLVISDRAVSYQDISDDDHSRSWNYSEIKELKREGSNRIKIEPRSGDSFEFDVRGEGMSDSLYNLIAARVAAARAR